MIEHRLNYAISSAWCDDVLENNHGARTVAIPTRTPLPRHERTDTIHEGAPEPPCVGCRHQVKCKAQRLVCAAWRAYESRGRLLIEYRGRDLRPGTV